MIALRLPVCFSCLSIRSFKNVNAKPPIYYSSFYFSIVAPDLYKGTATRLTPNHSNRATSSNVISSNHAFLATNRVFYSSKSTNSPGKKPEKEDTDVSKSKNPKKEVKVYITLHNVDQSTSVTTVEEAKKIAERRNFKLVKINNLDSKSGRATYKLMTDAQYLKDDSGWVDSKSPRDKFIKGDKTVSLSSSTSEHDILVKAKMMKKWLSKQLEVRVVISGNIASGENIYSIIEKEVGSDGRIVQKRVKGQDIRFQIIPPKSNEETNRPKASPKDEKENTKV